MEEELAEEGEGFVSPLTGKPMTREQFMSNSNGDVFQPFLEVM